MSISKKHLRKIIKEEMKRVKILKARNLPITPSRKFKKAMTQNLQEIKAITDPAFRKEVKDYTGDFAHYKSSPLSCMVYLRESNGSVKRVEFDKLLKQCRAGAMSEQKLRKVVSSSLDHDVNMTGHYMRLHTELFDHMVTEGLVTEGGHATKKGKLLREQEKKTSLKESEMRKLSDHLLIDSYEKGLIQEIDWAKQAADIEADEARETAGEPSEEDVESLKTGGQKAFGAIGKGLKAVGKGIFAAIASPFKAWAWFKDKVWGGMKAIMNKMWSGIKALGQKFDIGWINSFVSWCEKAADMVKEFCNKNKWLKILCTIVAGIIISIAVSYVISLVTSMLAAQASAAAIAYLGTGGCVAGAAAGIASENKSRKGGILSEAAEALCAGAAQAANATALPALQAIKGGVKYFCSSCGCCKAESFQQAMNFIDNYGAELIKSGADTIASGGANMAQVMAGLGEYVGDCQTGGAKIIRLTMTYMQRIGADEYKEIFEVFQKLGAALTQKENFTAFLKVKSQLGLVKDILKDPAKAKEILGQLDNLGAQLGFDKIKDWLNIAQQAARGAQGPAAVLGKETAKVAGAALTSLEEHEIKELQRFNKLAGVLT